MREIRESVRFEIEGNRIREADGTWKLVFCAKTDDEGVQALTNALTSYERLIGLLAKKFGSPEMIQQLAVVLPAITASWKTPKGKKGSKKGPGGWFATPFEGPERPFVQVAATEGEILQATKNARRRARRNYKNRAQQIKRQGEQAVEAMKQRLEAVNAMKATANPAPKTKPAPTKPAKK